MESSCGTEKYIGNETTGFSFKVPECVAATCYEYRGTVMPNFMPIDCRQALEKFEVRHDDIFVITYPKSGTTWMQQIMLLVKFDGDIDNQGGRNVMELVPFLDMLDIFTSPDNFEEATPIILTACDMPSPRMLKSHAPTRLLPVDLRGDEPKAKVIYVARNPKDVAVSYYHFCRFARGLPFYETWDLFFEEFLAGRAPQGNWFENVLPWWRRRNHPNVLFLKYEDMQKDLKGAVKQVARFMEKSLADDVIDRIVEASRFDRMKIDTQSNPDSLFPKTDTAKKEGASFMRKGAVGNWKHYFTVDQNRRFDKLYARKLAGTGLVFEFE
ncbi:sulfotransferase 1A1-like [Diadema antillarum]|uniref:sulfotransferase 1A1-like n=1 Tax=Diadema antillarum TaxID=105358 RepID=UPI003A8B13AE